LTDLVIATFRLDGQLLELARELAAYGGLRARVMISVGWLVRAEGICAARRGGRV
jgi:hypothetical protein